MFTLEETPWMPHEIIVWDQERQKPEIDRGAHLELPLDPKPKHEVDAYVIDLR